MKILLISDVHSRYEHFPVQLMPEADLCLLAGDITSAGKEWPYDWQKAKQWLRELGNKYQLISIPGNHDIGITARELEEFGKCAWNKSVVVQGYKIFGVSMSPCYSAPEIAARWCNSTVRPEVEFAAYAQIPADTDIVLSHCPPFRNLDKTADGNHIGSESLLRFIRKRQPKLVVCGHVHEAAGQLNIGKTRVINTACSYSVFELEVVV